MRIEKWLHNKCEENRSPILNSLFIYPAFLNSQSPIYQVFENSIARYLEKHGHPYIQLKAVLFDMDGVLFNSMPYHADAWHKVMERHGLHLSREEAYMHEGRTGASTINIVYQRQYGKDAKEEIGTKDKPVKRRIQYPPGTGTYAGCLGSAAKGKSGRTYSGTCHRFGPTLPAEPPCPQLPWYVSARPHGDRL